ncbi:hypothetical protein JOM56_008988 [Amanita muscaria]
MTSCYAHTYFSPDKFYAEHSSIQRSRTLNLLHPLWTLPSTGFRDYAEAAGPDTSSLKTARMPQWLLQRLKDCQTHNPRLPVIHSAFPISRQATVYITRTTPHPRKRNTFTAALWHKLSTPVQSSATSVVFINAFISVRFVSMCCGCVVGQQGEEGCCP